MRRNKAQSSIEYAVLICIAVAALLGTKLFLQRTVQDRYRQAGDVFGEGRQYASGTVVEYDKGISGTSPTPFITRSCGSIKMEIEALETAIENIQGMYSTESIIAYAEELREQAQDKEEEALGYEATAASKRTTAANDRAQIAVDQGKIPGLLADYYNNHCENYASGSCSAGDPSSMNCFCDGIRDDISTLQTEISTLNSEANDLEAEAEEYDEKAERARAVAEELSDSADSATEEAEAARAAYLAEVQPEIDAKQEKIDQYKIDYASCFSGG